MLMPAESPCQAHPVPLIIATAIARRHLLVVDVTQRPIRKHSVVALLLVDDETSSLFLPLFLAAPSAKEGVAPETEAEVAIGILQNIATFVAHLAQVLARPPTIVASLDP